MSYAMRVTSLDHAPTRGSDQWLAGDKQDTCCAGFPCCRAVSHNVLYVMAASIWALGSFACFADGIGILRFANDNGASRDQRMACVLASLACGIPLGWFVFRVLASRNVERLETADNPAWHACFRARFWLFIIVFDGLTEYLGHSVAQGTSQGDIAWQLSFSGLDFAMGMALFISLFTYVARWNGFRVQGGKGGQGLAAALINEYQEVETGDGNAGAGAAGRGSNSKGKAIVDSNA